MSQKRILFICQYFYPEVFRGNDIAFHWAQQGHDVHVIAGIPNYPEGKFFKGYGILKKRKETLKYCLLSDHNTYLSPINII